MINEWCEGKGGIKAKVIADSTFKEMGEDHRITTLQLIFHRFILPEFNTHRQFSRNASSSRAIPVNKLLEQIRTKPAKPIHWGKNQPGMQAHEENDELVCWPEQVCYEKDIAWTICAEEAAVNAEAFMDSNYHKQIVNRITEPYQFINVVVTATEWKNFFDLRIHKDAQPEIYELANCIFNAMEISTPNKLKTGEWHLPYVDVDDFESVDLAIKCSAARCARVSYLNHDNSTPSIEKDLELYNMLAVRPFDDGNGHVLDANDPVHLSPLEHQATPMEIMKNTDRIDINSINDGITHFDRYGNAWSGNFKGWIQYRQLKDIF